MLFAAIHLLAHILVAQDKAGEEQLKELCTKAKLQAGQFLAAVPEIDPPDLPEPKAFLASQGLSAVPV